MVQIRIPRRALLIGALALPLALVVQLGRASPPDIDDVRATVRLATPPSTYRTMVDTMVNALRPVILEEHPGGPPDRFEARLLSLILDVLPYEDVVDWQSEAMSARLTAEEIAAIRAFHESPAGKRLLAEQGAIAEAVAARMQAAMKDRYPLAAVRHGLQAPRKP